MVFISWQPYFVLLGSSLSHMYTPFTIRVHVGGKSLPPPPICKRRAIFFPYSLQIFFSVRDSSCRRLREASVRAHVVDAWDRRRKKDGEEGI
jgi:hypothetical protein